VVYHPPAQVAEIIGVHPETVASWIRSGDLDAVCISESEHSTRKKYAITDEQLAAFNQRRSTRKSAPVAKPTTSKAVAVPAGGYKKRYEE
jgi:predicted site-specific integrase-resolvase